MFKKILCSLISVIMICSVSVQGFADLESPVKRNNTALSDTSQSDSDSDTQTDTESHSDVIWEPDPDSDFSGPVYPTTLKGWGHWITELCNEILSVYERQLNPEKGYEPLCELTEAAKTAKSYIDDENILQAMSIDEAKNYFYELWNCADKFVNKKACTDLLEFCAKEKESNSNLKTDYWDEFLNYLQAAEESYKKYGTCLKRQYYDLETCYNNFIDNTLNNTPNDINKDNKLDLLDVVLLQKYIAGLTDFSVTQIYSVSHSKYNDANMQTVVEMQKVIAKLKDIDTLSHELEYNYGDWYGSMISYQYDIKYFDFSYHIC